MDYLVTFEDGSSGYLAHYGVKGMKWGVWNSETMRRYRISKRRRRFDRINSRYEKKSKAIDKAFNKNAKTAATTLNKVSRDPSTKYTTKTFKLHKQMEKYFDRQPGTSEEVRDRYNSRISSLADLTSTPSQKENALKALAEVKADTARGRTPTYYTYGYEKGTLPIAESIAKQVRKSIGSSYDKNAIYGHPKEVSDKIHSEANRLTKEALGDYGRQLVYEGQSGYVRVKDIDYNVELHSVVANVSGNLVDYPDLINKRGI